MHFANMGFSTDLPFIWAIFHYRLTGIREVALRTLMFITVANTTA